MGRKTCTEPHCLYSRAVPLLPLWAVRPVQNLSACTVELYLYSPYWPYDLYRASVLVQYSYTSTPCMGRTACTERQCLYSRATSLLLLWAVRLLKSLSACTVDLYLYSPYGPYGLYRASVPVQYSYTSTPPMDRTACTVPQCLYSTAIPLLPLWTVRPLQSLSACTVQLYLYTTYGPYALYRASVPVQYSYTCTPPYGPYGLYRASVPVQYSYTSTPLMDRTAFTEPQCLYSTATPLLPQWAVRPVQNLSACTVPQCLYSTAMPLLPLQTVRLVQNLSACTRAHTLSFVEIRLTLQTTFHVLLLPRFPVFDWQSDISVIMYVIIQSQWPSCLRRTSAAAGLLGLCSNPTWRIDVSLLWVMCVVRQTSLRRADHSSRGVIPIMLRLNVILNSG